VIRAHWGVENRNHYVRDVSCGEDKSRIRTNPGIMARARSFALNILRHNGVPNVAKALWAGALDLDIVLNYKGLCSALNSPAVNALHPHFTVKADLAKVGESVRVIGIRFVGRHIKRCLGVAGIDAYSTKAARQN